MPAVNWDQPSTGLVSDPAPSLVLKNDKGEALNARSRDVAVDARSKEAEALLALTGDTVAARIRSEQSIGTISYGPRATGAIGVNEAPAVAVAGVNLVDPAKPVDSRDGVGVAGLSNRAIAYGVVGMTFGVRSTGVLGNAQGGGVGVRGLGPQGGVEGASAQGHGVAGTSQSKNAAGVFGYAPGPQGGGVVGQSTAGPGVDGSSSAGTGVHGTSTQARGVVGESTGSNASGVFGRNDLGSGVGVDGYSQAGTAMRATSSSGTGLQVQSFSGGGIDVANTSTGKPALKAYSPGKPGVDAMSLTDAAVRGGSAHAGVAGVAIGASKPGDPEAGCGTYGNAIGGTGACGITLIGTGVLGIGYPQLNAWAGRFVGNVHVDGILFKSASWFSIDHPLDPERKVLNHACVESPEYKTFYDGVATLDRRGQATIRLPRWFDALNHELRYQLTAIGAAAPELHVAREAKGGTFAIAGGAPGQRVSWQVTGVRRDKWARAHPMAVEQPRSAARSPAPAVTLADVRRVAALAEKSAKALRATEKARRKPVKQPGDLDLRAAKPPAAGGDEGATRATRELLRDIGRLPPMPDA
jgi:hypothetical protein